MAVSNRGRPVCMAAIDFRLDPSQELYDRFYKACRTLDRSDIRKLARALHISERTVIYWKQTTTFPVTRGTAERVIQWVNEGKPVEFKTQAQIAAAIY
jgi:hypothetical protein